MQENTWEKRFEERFLIDKDWGEIFGSDEFNIEELKSFIQTEIDSVEKHCNEALTQMNETYNEQSKLDILEERNRILGIIEEAEKKLHGGGNARRLFIQMKGKINGE